MKRVAYSTTINKETLKNFKIKCEEDRINMNDVIEGLMSLYIDNKIKIEKSFKINM